MHLNKSQYKCAKILKTTQQNRTITNLKQQYIICKKKKIRSEKVYGKMIKTKTKSINYKLAIFHTPKCARAKQHPHSSTSREVNGAPLVPVKGQDGPIGSHAGITVSMHRVALAFPRGYLEPNHRRHLQAEHHATASPIALELRPTLTVDGQRGPTENGVHDRRILGLLIKRKK